MGLEGGSAEGGCNGMAGCPGFMGHKDRRRRGQWRIVGTQGHRNWDVSQSAAQKDSSGGRDWRPRILSNLVKSSNQDLAAHLK